MLLKTRLLSSNSDPWTKVLTFPPRTDPGSEWYSELDHGGHGHEQEA